MNFKSDYIIEKITVDINTSNLEAAYSVKDNIDVFMKNELFPQLELLLDKYNQYHNVLRFSKLKVDLSVSKWDHFDEIKFKVCRQIEEQIKKQTEHTYKTVAKPKFGELVDQKEEVKYIPETENLWEIFIYFLKHAYLPWYGKEEHIDKLKKKEFWEESIKESGNLRQLKEILISSKAIRKRFIYQSSDYEIISFLIEVNPKLEKYEKKIIDFLSIVENPVRYVFSQLLLDISINIEQKYAINSFQTFITLIKKNELEITKGFGLDSFTELVQFIQNISVNPIFVDFEWFDLQENNNISPDSEQQPEHLMKDDHLPGLLKSNVVDFQNCLEGLVEVHSGIKTDYIKSTLYDIADTTSQVLFNDVTQYINEDNAFSFLEKDNSDITVYNAGLVILHPFLKQFFVQNEIAGKSGVISKEKFSMAVQSLHFLATGNENVFEGNLVFEKFMCGIPLGFPIEKESVLGISLKEEAVILLKELIRNWPALKQTSPEGVQQLFLQRDGKLIYKNNKYKLIVERKPQDLLLSKLNWGIGVIKLPWWKTLLFVEW